ncbi:hypothetical protein M0813_22618 [Anaeramoeba flamelloides]|uniref:Uncharacterized protein n=1 Tax=Anaeramoeba flamelloides TaxID=1746091 RepID=A0AAV7ZS50_9EUKA|nr:hypothetical protein M0812_12542 [Anaeramoeba flamelloides]KAJ6242478.1 hypothetical protein M0813_22618 [Anaeramoeba flamelloides]
MTKFSYVLIILCVFLPYTLALNPSKVMLHEKLFWEESCTTQPANIEITYIENYCYNYGMKQDGSYYYHTHGKSVDWVTCEGLTCESGCEIYWTQPIDGCYHINNAESSVISLEKKKTNETIVIFQKVYEDTDCKDKYDITTYMQGVCYNDQGYSYMVVPVKNTVELFYSGTTNCKESQQYNYDLDTCINIEGNYNSMSFSLYKPEEYKKSD